MDGDIAPLPELSEVAEKFDAVLIVDDAHGTGVVGKTGSGTMEHYNLEGRPDTVIIGTMGKAMGCFGAFAAGTTEFKEFLVNRSRSFIFTTALPPSVVASAIQALDIIKKESWRINALNRNHSFLRSALNEWGFNTLESETPIIPIITGRSETAVAMAEFLFDHGIFIQAIRPPTVPRGAARLRLTVMATHTMDDLNMALEAIVKAGKHFRII